MLFKMQQKRPSKPIFCQKTANFGQRLCKTATRNYDVVRFFAFFVHNLQAQV
jgi:hypothetical protein